MKKTFAGVVFMGVSVLVVAMILLESGHIHRSRSSAAGFGGALQEDDAAFASGLASHSSALQKRLAMAQERVRQANSKVEEARRSAIEVERTEQQKQWMASHPVQLETAQSWEDWKPSVTSWFKIKGESEEEFNRRIRSNMTKVSGGSRPLSQEPHSPERAAVPSNRLVSLKLSSADSRSPKPLKLKPSFRPDVLKYNAYAGSELQRFTVLAETASPQAGVLTIDGEQQTEASAAGSGLAVPFSGVGAQRVVVRVQPHNGSPPLEYVVVVWKQLPKGTKIGNYISARSSTGKECGSSRDCKGRQVCVWGRCRCPVLYKKQGSGGCAPQTSTAEWCLWPLDAVPLTTLFDVTHEGTLEEVSELQGPNRPAYSRELAISKYFGGLQARSSDLLLHAANKLGKDLAARVEGAAAKMKPAQADLRDPSWGIDWGICAVVGSSASLLSSGYGAVIDDHTAVIRVGDSPTRSHERDVGAWTSLRRQSPETAGFSEGRGTGNHGAEVCVVNVRSKRGGEETGGLGSGRSKCTTVELSPQFEQYMRLGWRAFPPGGQQPSVATWSPDFTAVALAMHLCGRVDLFGVDPAFGSGGVGGGGGAFHSYSTTTTRLKGGPNAGNAKLEGACLAELGKKLSGLEIFDS
mmetsp:Transcript_21023/g.58331  ORF Transcript_21023/g.58331 Transcript_21023/m.58331 type:complete len:635 (-) Transcript_21023:209-2113(-)